MQTTPSNTADDMAIQGVTQIHLIVPIQYGDTQKPQHRDTHITKRNVNRSHYKDDNN